MNFEKEKEFEEVQVRIQEMADGDENNTLSILDIKAAIAEQEIPVSELFSKQDLSANATVLALVHEAETKAKGVITKKNVILEKKVTDLQDFKDKTDTLELIETSKVLADKDGRIIGYIKARLATGKGVDLTGDLTEEQRQGKVNEAITKELSLIEDQGITFRSKKEKDKPAGTTEEEEIDYTESENNPLIPTTEEEG